MYFISAVVTPKTRSMSSHQTRFCASLYPRNSGQLVLIFFCCGSLFFSSSRKVDSFPGLGKEMEDGRDFSPENRPALDDIYGVKSGGAKSVAA